MMRLVYFQFLLLAALGVVLPSVANALFVSRGFSLAAEPEIRKEKQAPNTNADAIRALKPYTVSAFLKRMGKVPYAEGGPEGQPEGVSPRILAQ